MQSIVNNNNSKHTNVSQHEQLDFHLVYYSTNTEYDLVMSKYQFHDSGIADEGLSDEDESNHQENQLGKNCSSGRFSNEDVCRFQDDHDRPKKPSQSYLEIIAEAILKAPNRMMQLYEIYTYFQRK